MICLVDKPQDTAGHEPSDSGSLYVKYLDLRNQSHAESRKGNEKTLTDFFIKFMIEDPENSRIKPKPSGSCSVHGQKTNKVEKPQ